MPSSCNQKVQMVNNSQKYWWELNLVVGSQITFARILVDLNLAVWYRIAIHIILLCKQEALADFDLVVVKVDHETTNLIPCQIFCLYGSYRISLNSPSP